MPSTSRPSTRVRGSRQAAASSALLEGPLPVLVVSGWKVRAPPWTSRTTTSAMNPKCQAIDRWIAAPIAPAAAPTTVPTEKKPCSAGMMPLPSARSMAAPWTLEATFQLAVPMPWSASASPVSATEPKTAEPMPAAAMASDASVAPSTMVRLDPSLITMKPEAETDRKEPAVMHSSSRPTSPWLSPSASRTEGSLATSVEMTSPEAKYVAMTPLRQGSTSGLATAFTGRGLAWPALAPGRDPLLRIAPGPAP